MQQDNKHEMTLIVMFLVFVGWAIMVIALAIGIASCFLCFILTILSLVAWNKPLRIGKIVIMPQEARMFVGSGLFGAFAVPAFILVCQLFGLVVDWSYLGYFAVGGYVCGSMGAFAAMQDEEETEDAVYPPQPTLPRSEIERLPPPAPAERFRYASWDDEEKR